MNKTKFTSVGLLLIILLSSISFADYNESFISTTDGIQVMLKEVADNSYILTILNERNYNHNLESEQIIIDKQPDRLLNDNSKRISGFIPPRDVLSPNIESERNINMCETSLDKDKEFFILHTDYNSRTVEG